METFILITSLLLAITNGNFAQGLDHWNAGPGWSAAKGAAVIQTDNRAGVDTFGSNLCSEPVPVVPKQKVSGAADVYTDRKYGAGYVYVGVQWRDGKGAPFYTEMLATNEGRERQWLRLAFKTKAPKAARSVSFCFFTGTYAGSTFKATVDNAVLQ